MEYKYFIPAKKVRGQFRARSIKLKQMQIECEEIPEGSRRYLFFKTGWIRKFIMHEQKLAERWLFFSALTLP